MMGQLEGKIRELENQVRKKGQEAKVSSERVVVLEKEKRELLEEQKKNVAGENTLTLKTK
jgi:hypothetical protein